MNIYLLKQVEAVSYDMYDSFVVIAPTPKAARELASSNAGAEGKESWLDKRRSSCSLLGLTSQSKPAVVCGSFNAG